MKYACSKHGNNGDPDCEECWNTLYKMITDKDAILVGDHP